MKKINFKAIEVEDIEGQVQKVDIAKALGNQLYMQGQNVEECELGRLIYFSETAMELNDEQMQIVKRFTRSYPYISRHAIDLLLER